MSDWELIEEYQDYLSGRISKREWKGKYHKRKEKLEARKECKKCTRGCAPWLLCWPCAGLCFEEEEWKCQRRGCAASLSGVFYGGITTALSSDAFYSSPFGLKCGITMLVIGCLCGLGLCAYKFDCVPEINPNAPISNQPQRRSDDDLV